MKIEIIGAGRLGRSLYHSFQSTEHIAVIRERGQGDTSPDVRLLTVPDAKIGVLARTLPVGVPVLHCSGCLGHDVLAPHVSAGTFHPLMTFPGPEIMLPSLHGVTATLSGTAEAVEIGISLANALGMTPVTFSGDRRLYHASAVIAGNFSALVLAQGATVLAECGFKVEEAKAMLLPLAIASIQNLVRANAAMTGPASRGDLETIKAHEIALLESGLEGPHELYKLLSQQLRSLTTQGAS